MRYLVEHPIATIMLYLALSLLGVYSFINTPIELAPNEQYPKLFIQTYWPEVPPEIIQAQVTAPLEEAVTSVKGMKKLTSESGIGFSRLDLEFFPKTDMEFATLALQQKIAQIQRQLPWNVKPSITPYQPPEFQKYNFLTYTISGNYSLERLRELIKERMEYGLGGIKGVEGVSVTGGSDPEIRITLDGEKMQALNVQPYTVRNVLGQWSRTFSAGKVLRGNQEYLFKISSLIPNIASLQNMIIGRSGGVPIRLQDVADVAPSYSDVSNINRINGQPTITLTVYKRSGTSTLKVAKLAKAKLEEIRKQLPSDLIFRKTEDESENIQKNFRELFLLAAVIIPVVFLVIFVILRSVKPSLLIISSIFFSILFTFNLIYIFKIELNMLTLGALALGFGMFVDNSIVVFENILRLKEQGMDLKKAAIQGAEEVFVAVTASTLTTICVFFTFPYFQGKLRMYYLPLAIVISSALAASMLVSFTLIPSLTPMLLSGVKSGRKEKLRPAYEKILKFCMRRPFEVTLLVVLLFYGSHKWFKKEVSIGDWWRPNLEQRLVVYLNMPPGTELQTMDEVVGKFEAKALEKAYEMEMVSRISAETGFINIKFPPEIELSFRPYVLKEELIQLATQFAGLSVGIYGFDPQGYSSSMEPGIWYSSRINFFGYNLKKLNEITDEVARRLTQNPRIKDWKKASAIWGWRIDSTENILKIDREKLQRYDIDPAYLFFYIQSLTRGNTQTSQFKLKMDGRELPVAIKFPDAERLDMVKLQNQLIRTPNGQYFRLKDITRLEERPIAGSIVRENQQFQQVLMWEFRGPSKAEENYRKNVFSSLVLPPGFSATMDYGWRMTEKEMAQIKFAIIISLIIIFMLLASLYESLIDPFFVMLAVPLELIGVFIAFVIADAPFNDSAYIGVILLGGIVVNNAILLVDHINLRHKQGLSFLDAVITGARERIRPIFLTAGTTVFGLLPMVLIKTDPRGNKIWSSLALCTLGGLTSSALLVLIIVPTYYYHGHRLRSWARKRILELKTLKDKL